MGATWGNDRCHQVSLFDESDKEKARKCIAECKELLRAAISRNKDLRSSRKEK